MHQHTEYHTFKDYIPIDRNKTTMLILQFLEKIKYQNIARMSQFRPNMFACLGSDILTTSSRKAPTGIFFELKTSIFKTSSSCLKNEYTISDLITKHLAAA